MQLKTSLKHLFKKLLSSSGYEINTIGSRGLGYISADDVINKAKANKQTVDQYLEELWGLETHAAAIIRNFDIEDHLPQEEYRIVEIGAGTGVYLKKLTETLAAKKITYYQVYETAADWAGYLKKTYPVDLPAPNGYQLSSTDSDSIDIAHAHGVFVYTSFITSISYLREMIRVVKKDGIIAFDVFDESSYDREIITKWIDSGHTYPNIIPERMILELFPAAEFKLLKTFHTAFEPGRSRYFVFKKLT